MSQRFIRCSHCGIPHDVDQILCPSTGKAIRSKSSKPKDPMAQRAVPAPAPARPAAAVAPNRPADPAPRHSAPPASRKPRTLIGTTIGGKYAVRGILGEGGMGAVFEGEHLSLGRSIAIKILHAAQAAKRDVVRRFHQEARAAAAIGHPNICGIIDLGTLDDGSPYIVMERLVGETLADRIASEGALPFGDAIEILVQVLSGLVAAHEQRIVHRDIKPENVFLTTRVGCPPVVKILDFGVSKVTGGGREEELSLTRTGMVMGTPYYMAPEQARGERDLDARVDLYACGVIFYEVLTGRRPFTASNYNALLVQILSASPRPPRDLRPALPAGFSEVIDKAMARRREDRYASAAEFQQDLQALRDRHSTKLSGAAFATLGARRGPSSPQHQAPLPQPFRDEDREPPTVPSSSVEIPVTFANDTPTSGGAFPADPTEVHLRTVDTSQNRAADDDEGDPTQLMAPGRPSRR